MVEFRNRASPLKVIFGKRLQFGIYSLQAGVEIRQVRFKALKTEYDVRGWRCMVLLAALLLVVLLPIRGSGQQPSAAALLTLHDAILQAQASPQARESQDEVDAAKGGVRQAGLHPNPRLYLQSEDLRPWANSFDFPNTTEDYGYVGQVFELGGKRGHRLELARATVRQREAERLLSLQQIAGRVAAAYWTSVAGAGIVMLLEEDQLAVQKIVTYNKARVEAGAMRGVDLIRVQIEQDRLLLALETARREAAMSRVELFRQMGHVPDANVKLTDKLESSLPVQSVTVAEVLAGRADVAAARQAVTAAEADVQLQRSLGVPDLDLLGGYKRNSGADTLYTGLQIPLSFRNRNQGEIERAVANVHRAQDRLEQLELSVRADVYAAQEDYARQQRVIHEVLPEMRTRAKQNLTIMDDAYRTGGVDLLRYLDAERTAFDVEVSALRSLAEFQQAALRLQLAYGMHP